MPCTRNRCLTLALLIFCLTVVGFAQTQTPSPTESVNAALADLDSYIRSSMNATKVPGVAVAIVYNGDVIFLRGYGIRKIGDPAQVDPDTVFEIASFSKPIASSILASMVGQGKISWDDRIADLDPNFQLSSPETTRLVTIRDFLSHRSGLATLSGDMLEDLGYSRPQILYRMRYLPLPGQLGKTYAYSNFGYTTAAIAASLKVGKPWEEIADEQLYKPLGMTETSSRFSDYRNNPNKAAMHIFVDGEPVNRFVRDADAESPAGGVNSSARDLAKWMQMQLDNGKWDGKQIIDPTALVETRKPEVCRNPPDPATPNECSGNSYYGLGWDVGKEIQGHAEISHSGAFFQGAATAVYLVPDEHLGILALTNAMPVGLPEAICLHFLDMVNYGKEQHNYLALAGNVLSAMIKATQDSSPDYSTMPAPKNPAAAKPLSAYAGKYTNQYFGDLEVAVEGGRLILRLPPRGTYYELTHWDGDTFTYYFASENTGSGRRGAKFSPDKNQVLIESLAPENNAVFTKELHLEYVLQTTYQNRSQQ